MSKTVHTLMVLLLSIVFFLVGFATIYPLTGSMGPDQGFLAMALSALFCVVAVHFVREKVLFAKCPKCNGRYKSVGSRPIEFHCLSCGFHEKTKISFGSVSGE